MRKATNKQRTSFRLKAFKAQRKIMEIAVMSHILRWRLFLLMSRKKEEIESEKFYGSKIL